MQISVLMSVYNGERTLADSVDSILNQSLSDFELIICDDGSHDKTWEILCEYAEKDSRVKILRNKRNLGLAASLNRCITISAGEYIARQDDDDRAHPERLEREIAFLEQHEELTFVGCWVNEMQHGVHLTVRCLPEFPKLEDFLFTMPFVHPTLVFRRSALLLAKGYCEEKRCVLCEDYDLLLRFYHMGCYGGNLSECLLDYSVDGIRSGRRKFRYRINEAQTRWIHFRECGLLPRALPYVIKPLAVGLLPTPLRNFCRDWRNSRIERTSYGAADVEHFRDDF